jgi:release factor glutamine methyltransferase
MYHRRPMPDVADSESLLAAAARTVDRRDAELLLAAAASLTRTQLIARAGEALPPGTVARFETLCARRAAGEPVAYLLGRREFWSLDFEVTPAVLVPRPETELLVERALALQSESAADVADLGTGSGAIAIALALERPAWRITATDVSPDALDIARRNGDRHAAGRIEWLRGPVEDWYAPLAGRRFDILVSNPPYIAADDPVLTGESLRFEPRGALTPEGDGFAALLTLINGAPGHLQPGGWLALEHGAEQGERTRQALVARGFTHVTSHRDLAGRERITEGQISHGRF